MAHQSRLLQQLLALSLHGARIGLFVGTLWLIHREHRQWVGLMEFKRTSTYTLEDVQALFPNAVRLGRLIERNQSQLVHDIQNEIIGYVMQTAPQSDSSVGFSGPSNSLIAIDNNDRVVGVRLLGSVDTPDHVALIEESDWFDRVFAGKPRSQLKANPPVDVVSGATLTSLAILEGVCSRLGSQRRSLRFTDPMTVQEVREVFPETQDIVFSADHDGVLNAVSEKGQTLGRIVRSTPWTDSEIGFQGPHDIAIFLDQNDRIVTLRLRSSYDNQPYVRYVQEEEYFLDLFAGRHWSEMASIDLEAEQVEGVSGATVTSQSVAKTVATAAQLLPLDRDNSTSNDDARSLSWWHQWSSRDWGTAFVTLIGIAIAFRWVRLRKWMRFAYHGVLVVYLGFINGDLVSQALLVGWTQSGIPWRRTPGLVLLTLSALLIPIMSRKQVYCHHLCPHGAIQQQLIKLPWRLRVPRPLLRLLRVVPLLLLLVTVGVAMTHTSFSLAQIEPFDAYILQAAGWATITIWIAGLIISCFVPMAYCRFGCPTGALLGFLRFHGKSGYWQDRDWAALACFVLALVLTYR